MPGETREIVSLLPPVGETVKVRAAAAQRDETLRPYADRRGEVVGLRKFNKPPQVLVKFPREEKAVAISFQDVDVVSDLSLSKGELARDADRILRVAMGGDKPATSDGSKAKPIAWEHMAQCDLFTAIREEVDRDPWWCGIYAVPNGTFTLKSIAIDMVREGVEIGVPDMFCADARGGYHGLYIEMKVEGGSCSDEQRGWLSLLFCRDYCVDVCYCATEAWLRLCWYRALPPTVVVGPLAPIFSLRNLGASSEAAPGLSPRQRKVLGNGEK